MYIQKLYDLRKKTEFTSGEELHNFFEIQLGEPSPSGYQEIDAVIARIFVKQETAQMLQNNRGSKKIAAICHTARDTAKTW